MSGILNPMLEVIELTKRYPGVLANDCVSFSMYPGKIHGLLGENGSGKSTIIKTLSGVQKPDTGEIRLNGNPIQFANPVEARRAGISTVFQEFSIVPTLTVAENIFLGRLPLTDFGLVDWKKARASASLILERLGVELNPDAITGDLSVSNQQMVEIAKAVAAGSNILILDEPTAALGLDEIGKLHALLRRMRDHGASLLYVSHRLDEVVSIVDDVTILRNGRVTSPAGSTKVDINSIVSAMIGTEVKDHYPKENNVTSKEVLQVNKISTRSGVRNVSLKLHAGEVLGFGGVLGSGRTEIGRAIYGADSLIEGSIQLDGKLIKLKSPHDAISSGIGFLSENRKFDGLFFNFNGKQNISIASLNKLKSKGLLNLKLETISALELVNSLEITKEAPEKMVGHLSGGNQQKIILARWMLTGARVLILDEPTQGIDIGAKLAIYNLINELTAQGKSIILISSDHDELLSMSDRIAIVRYGTIVDIKPAKELIHADLVRASTNATFEKGVSNEIP